MNEKTENSTTEGEAAAQGLDGAEPAVARIGRGPGDRSLLTQVTRRAMATEFVVMLPAHAADAVEFAFLALEQLDVIEQALSVYRPDSEISRVNQSSAEQPIRLSEATFALLQKGLRWSERTEGAFDVTAGPLVEAWGFGRRRGRKPDQQDVEAALQRVGYQNLELSVEQQTVRMTRSGMSINLGAIGKGDALDRIASRLRDDGLNDFLIHGGNSSVIAAGDQTAGSGLGWAVGVAHPSKPKRRLAGLWLRDMALATSGSGKQFFHHRGQRYGHVIDPRTGYPAGDLLSLTVLMESAADADACATALFVAGSAGIDQHRTKSWFPDIVSVRAGVRQDGVEIDWQGEIRWVEDPQVEDPPE